MQTYILIALVFGLITSWYLGLSFWIVSAFAFGSIVVAFEPEPLFYMIYLPINLMLLIAPVREFVITTPLLALIKKLQLLPSISDTEKTALRAGDVWVEGEFFSGRPNFQRIFSESYPSLSEDEIAFLHNEVAHVCAMTNDYKVFAQRDLDSEIWEYLKANKFFGMIIPKAYGGLGFSALGHSAVVQKLASHSQVLAITTMVPNSLGPAELLLHYGTQAQKEHYLPRLADGRDIPCFALTEPLAGSDATSINAKGEVFKEGEKLYIRLNFSKRYITLGAVATIIGLAFVLEDPHNYLKKGKHPGITCALVDASKEGVIQGRRHDPLGVPFINSPVSGENVIIELDDIIGAIEGVGNGWAMLMESLSVGRGISLPSTSSGGVKLSAAVAGAYATVREQFGVSVAKFEGVEEVLADLAANAYMLDGARLFTLGAIDSGKKPAVINAVMKYHSTEIFRRSINAGMDVIGGAGISLGERNLLGHAYMGAPIAITVEGANIMTRSLIQFGQGVIRCHPYAYKEIQALENEDTKAFDRAFFSHVGFTFRNMMRAFLLSISKGYIYLPHARGIVGKYERKLVRSSATFAFLTDVVMAYYGGRLKQKERISGRFGDILSNMYLISATLRRFEAEGKSEDAIYIEYIAQRAFRTIDNAYNDIAANLFEPSFLRLLFSPIRLWMRFNRLAGDMDDTLIAKVAQSITKRSEQRDRLIEGIYLSKAYLNIEKALHLHEDTQAIVHKIKRAIKNHTLPKKSIYALLDEALKTHVITKEEHHHLERAKVAKEFAVQVDSFDIPSYLKRTLA